MEEEQPYIGPNFLKKKLHEIKDNLTMGIEEGMLHFHFVDIWFFG